MKHRSMTVLRAGMFLLSAVLFGVLVWLLWQTIPWAAVRWGILGLCAAIFAVVGLWAWYQRRQVSLFADDLCETLDALMSGRTVEGYQPYEDSLTAKVQGKLMQYFDIMSEGKRQSQRDKETIQGLVSDISHQVKTPIANIKMFTGILRGHDLPPEKRAEFLATMDGQIDKLDFLMQSLIKMSRLETGTFTLHMEEARLSDILHHQLFEQCGGPLGVALAGLGNGGGVIFSKIPLHILQHLVIGQVLVGHRREEYVVEIIHRRHPPRTRPRRPHPLPPARPAPSAPKRPAPC